MPTNERAQTVVTLWEKGYAGQMVVSHDACSFQGFLDGKYVEGFAPNWCYEHLSRDLLPALLAGGVSQTGVDTMITTNPKKIFSKNDGY